MLRNRWALALIVLFGSVLALILLWPVPIETTPLGSFVANWLANLIDPSASHLAKNYALLEIWLNVLIFVPFSLLIYLASRRSGCVLALSVSLVLSVLGELIQALILVKRVATVQDVLLNFAGAIIGVLLGKLISRLRKVRQA